MDKLPPDPVKLLGYWEEWERGETHARPGHGQPEDGRHARPAAPAGRAGRARRGVSAGPLSSGSRTAPAPPGRQPGRAPARGLAPRRAGPVVGAAGRRPVRAGRRGRRRARAAAERQRGAAVPRRPPVRRARRPPRRPAGAEVVLTRRSQSLRSHRGEISFPGGRLDAGETPEQAALREADEEVALAPEAVELVGRLPPLATVVSLSHIVPVVGRLRAVPCCDRRPPRSSASSTCRCGSCPTRHVFREERWGEAAMARSIYFFELEDETIWGATARILVDLLSVALGADV